MQRGPSHPAVRDKEVGISNRERTRVTPGTPDAYTCPACEGTDLIRVRRRLIDRVASLFLGVRRFRCTHPGCEWEGNLRKRKARRD